VLNLFSVRAQKGQRCECGLAPAIFPYSYELLRWSTKDQRSRPSTWKMKRLPPCHVEDLKLALLLYLGDAPSPAKCSTKAMQGGQEKRQSSVQTKHTTNDDDDDDSYLSSLSISQYQNDKAVDGGIRRGGDDGQNGVVGVRWAE
jgi:hypothetical protein